MADTCVGCSKQNNLNTLVLNGGELWIPFCDSCGDEETITNQETGEEVTLAELFERSETVASP